MPGVFRKALAIGLLLFLCVGLNGFAEDKTEDFRTIEDFNNEQVKLGVSAGSSAEIVIERQFPNAQRVYGNSASDQALMLANGKIDGFLFYDDSIADMVAQYPEFAAMPEPVQRNEDAFYAAKSEHGRELVDQFNRLIRALGESGEYEAICQKWAGEDESAKVLPELTSSGENGTLKFVRKWLQYPFGYYRDGTLVGSDTEVIIRYCNEYGYIPEFIEATSAIEGVVSGKYDFCFSQTTKTAEREETVLFTDIIGTSALYMLVRREDVAPGVLTNIDGVASELSIRTPEDINGHNLALMAGTVFVDAARNHFPDSETVYLNSVTDEALAVIRGDADALLTNDVVAASIVTEHSELFALPDCVDKYHASFTTPKTDEGIALGDAFDAFIAPLIESGEVSRILAKWRDQDALPVLPKVTYGTKKLHIAVDANDYPFSYQTADGFAGFNIELIDMFCEACGYEPVYTSAQLTAALTGIQTGAYDMLGVQLIETEERAEVMHFTLPLVEGDIKVIVRKADVSSSLLPEDHADAVASVSFWDKLALSFQKNFVRENR